jgi:hypothetical protein
MSGKCEKGKIRNPATGRCVKADGLVGLSIRRDTPTTSSPRKSTSRKSASLKSASRKSASRKSASKKPSAKTSAKASPTKKSASSRSAPSKIASPTSATKATNFEVTVRLYMKKLVPGVVVPTGAKFDEWMREITFGGEPRYIRLFTDLWQNFSMYGQNIRYAGDGKLIFDVRSKEPASVAEVKRFAVDTDHWDDTLYESADATYTPAGSEEVVGEVNMDKSKTTVVPLKA